MILDPCSLMTRIIKIKRENILEKLPMTALKKKAKELKIPKYFYL